MTLLNKYVQQIKDASISDFVTLEASIMHLTAGASYTVLWYMGKLVH